MTDVESVLSPLERAARRGWLSRAVDVRYGRCTCCGAVRDADRSPLLVARQPRRDWQCLVCWDQEGGGR